GRRRAPLTRSRVLAPQRSFERKVNGTTAIATCSPPGGGYALPGLRFLHAQKSRVAATPYPAYGLR
ncbi:hypothetical protein, partial [Leclercia sp.]|uniref:hypothetical protein n=1 Tax=Leclercia sp. TaxID=1898428 RepID=UPI0028978D69